MFRLFVALNTLFFHLYACQDGIDLCRHKVIDAKVLRGEAIHIPLADAKVLVFSKTTPKANILKHDPFLSLYLIKNEKNFPYPFHIDKTPTKKIYGVNTKVAAEQKIIKKQVGLNHFAQSGKPFSSPGLLLNSCCDLEGIITHRGIIEKSYIKRFLEKEDIRYGDIGIRVHTDEGRVIVKNSNPFLKKNLLKKKDIILEFNGKKVLDAASLMRAILFSKIGSTPGIKIQRNNRVMQLKTTVYERPGGGYISDTFLEFLGLAFDKNLCLVKIEKKAFPYGVRLGDKLLWINGKKVQTQEDISQIVDNPKKKANLLFQRGDFQFFVKVN